MPGFIQLAILKTCCSVVLKLHWSFYGEFLISCGTNKIFLIWGSFFKKKSMFLSSQKLNDLEYFSKWSCLCIFKSFLPNKTYGDVTWAFDSNQCCVGSFFGVFYLSQLIFFNKKKSLTIKKQDSCFSLVSEIKNCNYSHKGNLLCITTRNKKIWMWRKNNTRITNCFFVFKKCDSDIKHSIWHPKHKYFMTIEYEGIVNFFIKNKNTIIYKNHITLFFSTGWKIEFFENTTEFHLCTNRGDIIFFIKKIMSFHVVFCFLSTWVCFYFDTSKHNLFFLYVDIDENINTLNKCKFKIKNKMLNCFYSGSLFFFKFKIENSLKSLHLGNINFLIWHPIANNVVISCSNNNLICVLYYSCSIFIKLSKI